MANDKIKDLYEDRQQKLEDVVERVLKRRSGGSGDGTDLLIQRLDRVEKDVIEVRNDLKAVRSDTSEIKGKISMLPGWGGLLATTGFIVAAVGLMIRFLPGL